MKTSNAERVNYVCPRCGSRIARDRVGLGFARHLSRMADGTVCPEGPTGERDE
jgi:predicted RNA-binding Zn-ribbon protein involved in translation (DUF1610 family)